MTHLLAFLPVLPSLYSFPPSIESSPPPEGKATNQIKNNPDHQTATRTNSYLLPVPQVRNPDLEPVSTRTRVVVDLQRSVVRHVFDLDLVVYRHFRWERQARAGELDDGEVVVRLCVVVESGVPKDVE